MASSHGTVAVKGGGMSSPSTVSTKLQRIATLAREAPDMGITSLSHHIDLDWLREAFRRTRKDGAPGIDGKTGADYEENLEANLQDLLDRAKSGRYRAPPVRRVHIPKDRGGTRPIGIPTFEDKVLQRAVAMALEAVYEQDFLPCSYGFRPGRSQHQALQALWAQAMEMGGGWLVEVDIQSYFDTIDHARIQESLSRRVRDGVLRRLVGKWLNAGIQEEGRIHRPKAGSPQGGVISPLLSNVYLHEVLDVWFHEVVLPRLRGRAFLIRFADDVVALFEHEDDARRFFGVLPKRLEKYGLTLHPEKTRLVAFRRPPRGGRPPAGGEPGTFDLLGFTHYWGLSRKGSWVIKRRTAKDRFRRACHRIAVWCRTHRHERVFGQHQELTRKLRGHFAYYGVTGNYRALKKFLYRVERTWFRWLRRRGQKRLLSWECFRAYLARMPLPAARIVHGYTPVLANP